MKQLIPQSKIDEAAKLHIYECIEKSEYDRSELSFNAGVQFALNKIEPLMVEMLEWTRKNLDGNWDENAWLNKRNGSELTSQQLLEEFINSKNKNNE